MAIGALGALCGCRSAVHDVLAEIESGQRLEQDDFSHLVAGTRLTVNDIEKRVMDKAWYLTATEAEKCGLVAGVV